MAEVKVKEETDRWHPVEVQNRIRELCQQSPHGVTLEMIQRDMPHVGPHERANAINRLLTWGHLDLQKGSAGLLFKMKYSQDDSKTSCSDHQLCQTIKDEHHKDIQIKEEQDFIKQEQEQCHDFPFYPTDVKSEDDKTFQLSQKQNEDCKEEIIGENRDGSKPDWSSDLHGHSESDSSQLTENSSDMDSDEDSTTNKRTQTKNSTTKNSAHSQASMGGDTKHTRSFSKSKCWEMQKIKTAPKKSERVTDHGLPVRDLHAKTKQCECTECGKTFRYNSDLKRHALTHLGKRRALTHAGERPFSCSVCHKTFTRKVHLTTHTFLHMGVKPFSCPVCERSFVDKRSLVKHRATHPEANPFSCSVCKEHFKDHRALKMHSQSHKESREFSCSECGMIFSRNQHLVRHMTVHSGEKPFSCTACKKGFSRKDYLHSHMKFHSRPESLCPICNICITHKYRMKAHMRKEHSAA